MVSKKKSKVTTDALRRQINSLLEDLFAHNALAHYNLSVLDERTGRISWVRKSPESMISDFSYLTVGNYLEWARRDDYSALLPDGSLIQMTYTLSGTEIVGHRLCYVPSPVTTLADWREAIESEGWIGGDYAEIVSEILLESHSHSALKSMVRFDYDPRNARIGHPSSHLTINSVDCRIPCIAPLSPFDFVGFIFEHFYPAERRRLDQFFAGLPKIERNANLLLEDHRNAMHLAW